MDEGLLVDASHALDGTHVVSILSAHCSGAWSAGMLRFDLPVGLLLLPGLLQGGQLTLGEDDALLGRPGLQSLEPFLEGLQVVAQPHRTDAAGGDDDAILTQIISGA